MLQDTASRKRLLLCCRQSGKSTITAMVAVHQAIYLGPSLVLLISPSQRQSGELFRKCRTFWSQLPDAPAALNENQSTLDLSNGSRIISLPGSEATTRGYSAADLVIVDEASRRKACRLCSMVPKHRSASRGSPGATPTDIVFFETSKPTNVIVSTLSASHV